MTLNIQGLVALDKRINLSKLIIKLCPSLLCLQETNLDPLLHSNVFIKGYKVLINPAYRKGSGTLVCVSESVKFVDHQILVPGHVQVLRFQCDQQIYTLFNVYLPFEDDFAIRIVNAIRSKIVSEQGTNLLLAGDFNYVDNIALDRVSSSYDRPRLRLVMLDLLTLFLFQDTFRILFPYLVKMTHFGTQAHRPGSRIDRIYVSSTLTSKVLRSDFLPSISDHLIFSVSIMLGSRKNARVHWRMDNALLDDPSFVEDVKEMLASFSNAPDKSFKSYENLKFEIKSLCQIYERSHAHARRCRIRELLNGSSNEDVIEWLDEPNVSRLRKHPDGLSIEDVRPDLPPEGRASWIRTYFKNMFQAEPVLADGLETYLNGLPQVTGADYLSLAAPISENDIAHAIRHLSGGKAPGLDGLSAEFFKCFARELTPTLKWLWEAAYIRKILPKSFRYGSIGLIFKKGDSANLKNWRPITMSNCDYKVFAHVLTARLRSILPYLIGPYQTCNVKGRSIFDNLSFLRDNLPDAEGGALVSLDQEAAFTRVDHGYLYKVLLKFGFPPNFIDMIKLLYADNYAVVNFGGGLTSPINVTRGVKQGDPMSASLFVLAIEPMLRALHKGMLRIAPSPFVHARETNLSAYADDTCPLVSDMRHFNLIERELALYGSYSGGKINIEKCEVMPFGNWVGQNLVFPYTNRNGLKVLGIHFGSERNLNWSRALDRVKSLLSSFSHNNLSLTTKVEILNQRVLSTLWYKLKVLDAPVNFLNEVRALCLNFIWNRGRY